MCKCHSCEMCYMKVKWELYLGKEEVQFGKSLIIGRRGMPGGNSTAWALFQRSLTWAVICCHVACTEKNMCRYKNHKLLLQNYCLSCGDTVILINLWLLGAETTIYKHAESVWLHKCWPWYYVWIAFKLLGEIRRYLDWLKGIFL